VANFNTIYSELRLSAEKVHIGGNFFKNKLVPPENGPLFPSVNYKYKSVCAMLSVFWDQLVMLIKNCTP